MSITPESGQLQTLIEGLSRGEEPQARDGKPGDPQLSALCQFLIQSDLVHSDVIVDFGSGNGVLAEYLSRVWPEGTQVPEYWAIDLPEMLDQLSLPSRVHNSSRKYTSEEFYKDVFPVNKDRIRLIVIRNTLHELDVIATSQLFDTIRLHLSAAGWVYIQDMARLKKPERRNVAWTRELLEGALTEIGFEVYGGFDLLSHGGTPWFVVLCRNSQNPSTAKSGSVLAKARSAQSANLLDKLRTVSKGFENVDELILLQHEFSCLEVQLIEAGFTKVPEYHEPSFEKIRIPIRAPIEDQLEYACATSEAISQKSGMIAIIASKRLLDFPTLISSAKEHIAFGGYSNRALFLNKANTSALTAAIRAGALVRVMVVASDSSVARLRSEEPIYDNADSFLADIRETINRGREFFSQAVDIFGREVAEARFQFRASGRIPRWSYFIVDDTCYLSFYSTALTGSQGPCFIFRALPSVTNNYFHLVQKEFSDLFDEAVNLLGGT